jgi:hypothetical protein
MIDWSSLPRTLVHAGVDRARFRGEIIPAGRPAIVRGLLEDWPAVRAAAAGPGALLDFLRPLGGLRPVEAFFGAPEIRGRFTYNAAFDGFNFDRLRLPFGDLLDRLWAARSLTDPPAFYAGAVRIPEVLPAFSAAHAMPLLDPVQERLHSLWIGNRSRVSAHWDLPRNLICVIGGARRYVLFPPEQIGNLYPGPVDVTPAGQPISLVDFHAPDYARFPKFAEALRHAEVAEVGPGDVLYLPSLWWHHAESLDAVGAMVNYWWRDAPAHMTTPSATLQHALLTLRDLPPEERRAWRAFFDHYIFGADADTLAHIPEAARGVLSAMTPELAARLRAHLARGLQW